MERSVSEKMCIKENTKAIFVNSDEEAIKNMKLPVLDITTKLENDFDYIHLFAKKQSEFITHFPKLKEHLKPTGMLWVSWPKGGNWKQT